MAAPADGQAERAAAKAMIYHARQSMCEDRAITPGAEERTSRSAPSHRPLPKVWFLL
jgi:hypothetical protein